MGTECSTRRFPLVVASVLAVASAFVGLEPSSARKSFVWDVYENEAGVRLSYAIPETDIFRYDFTCKAKAVELSYNMDTGDTSPYGTKKAIKVKLRIGTFSSVIPATATFDDGGSPSINTEMKNSPILLRALLNGGVVVTEDSWGRKSANAPSRRLVEQFARRCGLARLPVPASSNHPRSPVEQRSRP